MNTPQAALMRAVEHLTEHVKITVVRMDVHIIGNVVPIIGVRRGYRVKTRSHPRVQALYIIQLRQQPTASPMPSPSSVAELRGQI